MSTVVRVVAPAVNSGRYLAEIRAQTYPIGWAFGLAEYRDAEGRAGFPGVRPGRPHAGGTGARPSGLPLRFGVQLVVDRPSPPSARTARDEARFVEARSSREGAVSFGPGPAAR